MSAQTTEFMNGDGSVVDSLGLDDFERALDIVHRVTRRTPLETSRYLAEVSGALNWKVFGKAFQELRKHPAVSGVLVETRRLIEWVFDPLYTLTGR